MKSALPPITREALIALAQVTPGLDLFLLHGSRARGDTHAGSDWDFGYLGDSRLDVAGLLANLVETLHDERIDLADLAVAGALLRYRAARDGEVLFEARPGVGLQFRFEAVDFWCDIQPVLEPAYQAVLDRS